MPPAANLTTIPQELSDIIALTLTLLDPLGPPSALLPLMVSCRTLHARFSPHTNPALHASIFGRKFDSAAVSRRHGGAPPTPHGYVTQLHQYLTAMRVFRRGDAYEGVCDGLWGEDVPDIGLGEALQIGVVMMMEDDGKNARQLLLWARADVFVKRLLKRRLYAGAEANYGWPLDDEENANALWLLWLLTSEESLLRETQQERESITQLLMPFIYAPFRYSPFYAPPEHFLLPLPSSLPTPHGPHTFYPPPSTIFSMHYGTRRAMGQPPAALAAVLSFSARAEVHARAIPPHLARTRADLPEYLGADVVPTREDVEEVAWAWVARPPLGAGLTGRDGKRLLVEGWEGKEYSAADNNGEEGQGFPERPKGMPHPAPHSPIERWVGKAPHSPLPRAGKSVRWDADWARLRMCSDMWAPRRRGAGLGGSVGYVHTPGSLDGLWTGVMQLSSESVVHQLVRDASHTAQGSLAEEAVAASQPVSVLLREVVRVGGGRCCCRAATTDIWEDEEGEGEYEYEDEDGFSPDQDSDDEQEQETEDNPDDYFGLASDAAGIANAWFAGESPPVFVPLPPFPSSTLHHADSSSSSRPKSSAFVAHDASHPDSPDATHYQVRAADGSVSGIFRTHVRSRRERWDTQRLGNAAECPEYDSDFDLDLDTQSDVEAEVDMDSSRCVACAEREGEHNDSSKRSSWNMPEERARESLFTTLGLPSSRSHEAQTHDILLHGTTDPASARAWHPFTYHGRIRPWDGLVALVRTPKRAQDEHLGRAVFCGYVVGGEVLVGAWRMAGRGRWAQVGEFGVGGVFCWSRRMD
ncbi:hypothetical protein H0H81_010403 [Sphagnurus paluster]|uniref:F-box domain-containing protein n=1 Tax=Sphagnurus paluster TaxID=117069 RepID=A0A9P7K489_9AGAR|nr:hypothetical protein H0H81_010403 [Sphagnurus paluster]